MRKKRQCTGLMAHIMEEQVHQARLKFPVTEAGRFLDGAPQFLIAHRADVLLLLRKRLAQAGVVGAVRVEIGPQGYYNHHRPVRFGGSSQQIIHKRSPLVL